MHFTKMHGLGNDYLYIYGEVPAGVAELARRLSDRHFGAGADGIIYITPSEIADFGMRIFNADGSEAAMCGNGIRCVGKYIYDKGYTKSRMLRIETPAGIKHLTLEVDGGVVTAVSVDMGTANISPAMTLTVGDTKLVCTPVSMGNPHAVIFCPNADLVPLTTLGPLVEAHAAFPGGVNVEWASQLSPNRLRMRVWERGSGVTMACGTGAAAVAAAAVAAGICSPETPISVLLDGGALTITVHHDQTVTMRGPAAFVYEGECCGS